LWEHCSKLVFLSVFLPMITGAEADFEEVALHKENMGNQFDFIEKNFFKNSPYLVGSELSIADLALGTTLAHLEMIDFDCSQYPNIFQFWNMTQYSETFLTTHALFYKILKDFNKARSRNRTVSLINVSEEGMNMPIIPDHRGEFLRLYHVPGTRSTRVLWLSYELGLDLIRVQQVKWSSLAKPPFLEINPNGKIPVLVDDSLDTNKNMFESGAICDYLLQIVCPNNTLFPKTWTASNWSKHLVWKHWTIVTLDGRLISKMFGAGKVGNMINKTGQKIYETLIIPKLEHDLAEGDYVNGNEFTATDIYVGYTLFIAGVLKLVKPDTAISNYLERLKARPAWSKAFPDSL